jgi:hypothetical protein
LSYIGFNKLAAKTSPAIAAAVGRAKYGKDKFQHAAATGQKLDHTKPLKKVKHKHKKKVRRDSRGDTYTPGGKFDSAGDRIMGKRDSRGDRLK